MKFRLRQHFWDDVLISSIVKNGVPRDFVEVKVGYFASAYGQGGGNGSFGIPILYVGNQISIYGTQTGDTVKIDPEASAGTSLTAYDTAEGKRLYIAPGTLAGDIQLNKYAQFFPLKDMPIYNIYSPTWNWDTQPAKFNVGSQIVPNSNFYNSPISGAINIKVATGVSSGYTSAEFNPGVIGCTCIPVTMSMLRAMSADSTKSAFSIQKAYFSTYRQRFLFVLNMSDGSVHIAFSPWCKPVQFKMSEQYRDFYNTASKDSLLRNASNLEPDESLTLKDSYVNSVNTKMVGKFNVDSIIEPVLEIDDLTGYDTVQIKTMSATTVYARQTSDFADERYFDKSMYTKKKVTYLSKVTGSPSNIYGQPIDWIGGSVTALMNKLNSLGVTPFFISAHKSDPSQFVSVLIGIKDSVFYTASESQKVNVALNGTEFLDQFEKKEVRDLAFDNYPHSCYSIYGRDIIEFSKLSPYVANSLIELIVGVSKDDLIRFSESSWGGIFGSSQSLVEAIKEQAAKNKETELDPSKPNPGDHSSDIPSISKKSERDMFKVGIVFGSLFIGAMLLRGSK